jgi:hypothetical protein
MLFELFIEYTDGRTETKIITEEETTIHPQRDNIAHSGCKRFKYQVEKHNILPPTIVRFVNKTVIFPSQVECHPKTTLNDVVEIKSEEQKQEEKALIPQPERLKSWKFESASGGGTYIVTETKNGTLRCNCPGVWRAKDRKCKHIKEVESK